MTASLSREDAAELRRREDGLWRAATRNASVWMDEALAADFCEVGASGLVRSRAECLAPHHGEIVSRPLEAYRLVALSEDVAHARYRSATLEPDGTWRVCERSSIWRREHGAWRLFFHQGTLVPVAGAP